MEHQLTGKLKDMNNINDPSKKNQAGATLVEYSLWLLLAVIVLGGAYSLFTGVLGGTKSYQLSKDIAGAGSAIEASASGSGYYGSGVSLSEYLIRAGKIPSNWHTTGTAPNRVVTNQIGGKMEFTGRDDHYVVTANNVPGDICLGLFTSASSWDRVTVSSTDPTSISTTSGGDTPPYTQAKATIACSESSPNRIHFIK